MEIEEAKKRIKDLYKSNSETISVLKINNSDVKTAYKKENEALETVLQELDRLQRENEELKSFKGKIKQIIEGNVPIKEFLGVKNAVFDVNTCTYVTREIYDLLREE